MKIFMIQEIIFKAVNLGEELLRMASNLDCSFSPYVLCKKILSQVMLSKEKTTYFYISQISIKLCSFSSLSKFSTRHNKKGSNISINQAREGEH